MRCMERNKVTFYYANYIGITPILDEYQNDTGESEISYTEPAAFKANISAATGEIETRQFGESLDYDKVIALDDTAPYLDEYSILWVDTLPEFDKQGKTTTPHDYIVRKVGKSLNHKLLAISKVQVRV